MNLEQIKTQTTWEAASSSINNNNARINEAVVRLENSTYKNKGYFRTFEELKASYPSTGVGSLAYVGTTYPFHIYLWNKDSAKWEDSGKIGGDPYVNLNDYYTKVETDNKVSEASKAIDERIVQETGDSETLVISQKAVTIEVEKMQDNTNRMVNEMHERADVLQEDKASRKELSAESNRAKLAEQELSGRVDLKASKTELQSETNRSLNAEQALDLKINEESVRAKEVEDEQRTDFEANKFGFNVTVYGEHGGVHNLLSAIKDMPKKYRILGQKITFRTENGDWATYHNESLSLDNYENTENWVQEVGIKEVSGDVNITNAPDYEDLTEAENGTLKLADKEYSKSSFSGLGRIYLRKNIVNGVNILTQDMMLRENTRYVIQYDYEVGESFEIPKGSVMDFQGGSIKVGEAIIQNDVIYGYQVGLVPNNILYAEFNANKIAEVMNMGFKLIIDNIYYVGASNIILNRVNIQGLDKNSAKIILTDFGIDGAFVVSKIADYIGVRNLSIDTTLPKGYLCFNILFWVEEGAPMNLKNVDFDNLNVSGVRLVSFKVPDVDMSSWGIDKFHLSNINAHEIDMLVLMDNLPFNLLLMEGVNIKNIHRVGISAGTNNDYTNQSSIYAKKTIVRDCSIENDFIHTNKSAYLCLLVLEGVECHYYNNMAKNIVCTNNETPTYDSYLTCDILYYHNNSSINVVGMDKDGNVDIYKCKNSIGAGGRTLRNLSYNTYRLEETYFVANNLQDMAWSVKLGNVQSSINVFEFNNNYVNIEIGVFSFGGFISGFNVAIVTDNIIKAANANNSNGSSLIHISKNSSIDIINNKFLFGHKTVSDGYPSLFRYKHNMDNTNVRVYGNVTSNCDMFMEWEPQNYDYNSFAKWLATWEVDKNSFTYDKSLKNNIYKLHDSNVRCIDVNGNPCNLGNIYSIKDCNFYGPFVFGLDASGEYIDGKSDTRQFACEISIKDYVERFVVRLTYESGQLVKTEYEDAFGRIHEFKNKDYSSMERFYIADYFSLLIYPDKTRIERNFRTEGKATIYYANSHTKLSSYFTKMGGSLDDMSYAHPMGVPYLCTDKNLPEGYSGKSVIWNTGTSKMDSLGRAVSKDAPSPLSGTWNDKPSSETSTLRPVIGQGYFCIDIPNETEGEVGKMIYFKGQDTGGNDVWVDALGRVVTN